jgi:ribosomal-protein-alanine N-acetyltransferase
MRAADLTLRLAQPGDARAIATMSRDLIEIGLGWRYDETRVRRLIGDPETSTVVAWDGKQIAGFGIMTFGDEHVHLILLAVQPPRQRRGVGRQLVEWLLASARTAGAASITCELRTANDAAQAFYRSLGFVDAGRLDGYYGGCESATRLTRVLRCNEAAPYVWRPGPAAD